MTLFISELSDIIVFICISTFISIAIIVLSFFFSKNYSNSTKLSPYECGFDPFDNTKNEFDIQFYLVALMFLIFDIESIFIYPWLLNINKISSTGFWIIVDFYIELIIGFVYIWKTNILDWLYIIRKYRIKKRIAQ